LNFGRVRFHKTDHANFHGLGVILVDDNVILGGGQIDGAVFSRPGDRHVNQQLPLHPRIIDMDDVRSNGQRLHFEAAGRLRNMNKLFFPVILERHPVDRADIMNVQGNGKRRSADGRGIHRFVRLNVRLGHGFIDGLRTDRDGDIQRFGAIFRVGHRYDAGGMIFTRAYQRGVAKGVNCHV